MAQLVEHILGKDEVPGPNPGSSSRQPQRKPSGALVFYRNIPLPRSVWGCMELLLSLRERVATKRCGPVRICREGVSSLLVSTKRADLRHRRIPGQLQTSRCGSVTKRLWRYQRHSLPFCRFATQRKPSGALVFYRNIPLPRSVWGCRGATEAESCTVFARVFLRLLRHLTYPILYIEHASFLAIEKISSSKTILLYYKCAF